MTAVRGGFLKEGALQPSLRDEYHQEEQERPEAGAAVHSQGLPLKGASEGFTVGSVGHRSQARVALTTSCNRAGRGQGSRAVATGGPGGDHRPPQCCSPASSPSSWPPASSRRSSPCSTTGWRSACTRASSSASAGAPWPSARKASASASPTWRASPARRSSAT